MNSPTSKKRVRPISDDSPDSLDPKRLLLEFDSDESPDSLSHDLDSFIKTFQDELSPATPAPEVAGPVAGVNSGRPELGFLFEASDDELGLPPSETNTRVLAESVELSELWGMDDGFASYGLYEYEDVNAGNYSNGEYVALDGLFDHTDVGFGSSDVLWRPETLPAQ